MYTLQPRALFTPVARQASKDFVPRVVRGENPQGQRRTLSETER